MILAEGCIGVQCRCSYVTCSQQYLPHLGYAKRIHLMNPMGMCVFIGAYSSVRVWVWVGVVCGCDMQVYG